MTGLLWWDPDLVWRRGGTLYVSPEGSDWRTGSSPERPLATIQRAVDLARPGTTVAILPGRYRERVTVRRGGRAGASLVLRAQEPGSVVLCGDAGERVARDLHWKGDSGGFYETTVPWPVYRVMHGDRHLYSAYAAGTLRQYASRPGAWGAFFAEGPRLLVRLRDGANPAEERIRINGPAPERLATTGVWLAANLRIECGHVRLEGLRFEMGVACGVDVTEGHDVRIVDCLFGGAESGIAAGNAEGIDLLRCGFENYPQAEWCRGWWEGNSWLTQQEVYHSRGNDRGLLNSSGDGVRVQSCLVAHATDGMQVTTGPGPVERGADIVGNLIAYCTDDAVEFDGFAQHIRFRRNLVYDCHESIGASPVLTGPTRIDHNLFLHPAPGLNGAQVKLTNPWSGKPLSAGGGPIRNIEISNNTFVGNWICWWDKSPVRDVRVFRNVFAARRREERTWPDGVTHSRNTYLDLPLEGYPNPGRDPAWLSNRVPGLEEESPDDDPTEYRGATPPGTPWRMERPGPAWLAWSSHPAFAQLEEDLAPEIFVDP